MDQSGDNAVPHRRKIRINTFPWVSQCMKYREIKSITYLCNNFILDKLSILSTKILNLITSKIQLFNANMTQWEIPYHESLLHAQNY
jgi:hypothetical protein